MTQSPTHPLSPRDMLPQLVGPGAFYMSGEDQLQLAAFNSLAGVVVTFTGRFLDLDGQVTPFLFNLAPTSNRVATTMLARLGEGWLLNVNAFVSTGAPTIGRTFVRVTVVRGATGAVLELATLAAGYVTAGARIAWPGSPIASPLDGPGAIRTVTGTDPAAGAEIIETVPVGAQWILRAFAATFVTDATVSNREMTLVIDDGAGALLSRTASAIIQPAGNTFRYYADQNGAVVAGATLNVPHVPIAPLRLLGGMRIFTSVNNLQAGDNWGAPTLTVEEWIDA